MNKKNIYLLLFLIALGIMAFVYFRSGSGIATGEVNSITGGALGGKSYAEAVSTLNSITLNRDILKGNIYGSLDVRPVPINTPEKGVSNPFIPIVGAVRR